jgi:hypothetical protein
MFVTMIRLKQPSIQSIFTCNERCGDCRTFALRGSGARWGSGQLTWLEQVAPTPTKHLGTNCKAPSYSNLHRNDGALVSSNTKIGFLQKDSGRQSEGDSGRRSTFGNFRSLHSMSCWFSVPRLAQVGLDHFQLDRGSPA